jgi:hypothetical protein
MKCPDKCAECTLPVGNNQGICRGLEFGTASAILPRVDAPTLSNVSLCKRLLDALVMNWPMVVVGIGGVWAALSTLSVIKRQTAATESASKAALLNARAVINAERSWLVVGTFLDKEDPEVVRFGCRNQGRTPAKVISLSARPCFVKSPTDLDVPPDYSSPAVLPDLNIIVNADSFPIDHGVNARKFIQDKGKKDLIESSREYLVYYGNVIYRDTLYDESSPAGLHETRWCFFYQPYEKKFRRCGPEQYNRYT